MSDSGTSSSDGLPGDGPGSTEPTISFEKGTGSGPVYGAPDPNYTTPNYGTPDYGAPNYGAPNYGAPNSSIPGAGDQGQQFGPPPGAGYPPPAEGSGQYFAPPPPPYASGQYGGPLYPGGPGFMDPMAPYGRHPVTGEPFSDKQKLTAGLLNILLGAFGAGRFYLNQPGIAVAQIAVTWLTCGIGGIWPFIDGIMMLTGSVRDEHGRPLRD